MLIVNDQADTRELIREVLKECGSRAAHTSVNIRQITFRELAF